MPGHVFRVSLGAGEVGEGEVVALTGSSPELGAWARTSVLPMLRTGDSEDNRSGHQSATYLSNQFHSGIEIFLAIYTY